MAGDQYDVIVVGARCAGAPTAMHLARSGYRTLLVDKATFPSDTVSTHLIHPPGVAALHRWGLLDRLTATGCPPIHTYTFDFGDLTLAGSPAFDGAPVAYGPRRTVLDKLLVDAAREAGAEVSEGFSVDRRAPRRRPGCRDPRPRQRWSDGRQAGTSGRRGRRPALARRPDGRPGAVPREGPVAGRLLRDLEWRAHGRPLRDIRAPESGIRAAWPTNDDLTLVIAAWPYPEFEANRRDIEGNYSPKYARSRPDLR